MGVGFPGLSDINRQTLRAPVNPMDKATIVSIYPKVIIENKVSIQPGLFKIPAGTYESPSLLAVGPSSWWKEIDTEQPLLEIPVSAVRIAESVIKDYCNGLLGCDMGDRMPGLFYIPGEMPIDEIKKKFSAQLLLAQKRQKAWYEQLIVIADILWTRSGGNPLSISEDAKLAANELGMKDKPWLKDSITVGMKNCPACGSLMNPNYPICASCKTIVDPTAFKKLGLEKAV